MRTSQQLTIVLGDKPPITKTTSPATSVCVAGTVICGTVVVKVSVANDVPPPVKFSYSHCNAVCCENGFTVKFFPPAVAAPVPRRGRCADGCCAPSAAWLSRCLFSWTASVWQPEVLHHHPWLGHPVFPPAFLFP